MSDPEFNAPAFCFKNFFATIELLSCIVDNYICLSLVVVVPLNE